MTVAASFLAMRYIAKEKEAQDASMKSTGTAIPKRVVLTGEPGDAAIIFLSNEHIHSRVPKVGPAFHVPGPVGLGQVEVEG